MKKLVASLVIGFILGLALGLYIYNVYVTNVPRATDAEKGLVGIIVLFCVIGGTYLGYKVGEGDDP